MDRTEPPTRSAPRQLPGQLLQDCKICADATRSCRALIKEGLSLSTLRPLDCCYHRTDWTDRWSLERWLCESFASTTSPRSTLLAQALSLTADRPWV